ASYAVGRRFESFCGHVNKNKTTLILAAIGSIVLIAALVAFVATRDSGNDNDSTKSETRTSTLVEPETSKTTPSSDVEDPTEGLPDHVVDDLFLSFLREQTDDWDNVPDRDVLKMGLLICDGWDVGITFSEALDQFLKA